MSISSINGLNSPFQIPNKHKTGQILPGTSGTDDPSAIAGGLMQAAANAGTPDAASITTDTNTASDAVTEFAKFMKMTPAERMQYAWLQQHGISQQQFDAMSPAEKKKLVDEMKQDMEAKMKKDADTQVAKGGNADILV